MKGVSEIVSSRFQLMQVTRPVVVYCGTEAGESAGWGGVELRGGVGREGLGLGGSGIESFRWRKQVLVHCLFFVNACVCACVRGGGGVYYYNCYYYYYYCCCCCGC